MRKSLYVLAALIVVAAGVGITILASHPETEATAGPLPALESPAVSPAPLEAGSGCVVEDSLGIPEGVGVEGEVACCIDQCQTSLDCFFRCGGQPGECVMANPCCKECRCTASSLTSISQIS